jgi:hypothetical protein
MPTFLLDVYSPDDPECSRVIELDDTQTLADVDAAIRAEFSLGHADRYTFVMSGDPNDTETRISGVTGVPAPPAAGLRLVDLDITDGMCIAYLCDHEQTPHFDIHVTAGGPVDAATRYPRVVKREGKPRSHDDDDDHDDDHDHDHDHDHCALRPDFPVALVDHLRAVDAGQPEAIPALLAVLDACHDVVDAHAVEHVVNLSEIVHNVFAAAARAGDVDAVHHVATRVSALINGWSGWAGAVGALIEADRVDAANAAADTLLACDLDDAGRVFAADLIAVLGRTAAAESMLREVLGRRWLSGDVREEATLSLAELLRTTGRPAEARRLLAARHAAASRAREAQHGTVRHDTPRPGRNDPCPCGSGRKYKKCCGAAV